MSRELNTGYIELITNAEAEDSSDDDNHDVVTGSGDEVLPEGAQEQQQPPPPLPPQPPPVLDPPQPQQQPPLPAVRQGPSAHQRQYLRHRCIKTLVVLTRGMKDEAGQSMWVDLDEEPWSVFKKHEPQGSKPIQKDWAAELIRRWCVRNPDKDPNDKKSKCPRPKAWKLEKVLKALDEEETISAPEDISFFQTEIATEKAFAIQLLSTASLESNQLVGDKDAPWTGNIPILRLIHCIIDEDRNKRAYLVREKLSSSRMQVENRNSVVREPNVWELMTDSFNDPGFNPETEVAAYMHSDFSQSISLDYDLVKHMVEATPERCKDKIATINVELRRIIGNWERSGQGVGGVVEDPLTDVSDEFGNLEKRSTAALDQLSSFLDPRHTYMGYFWHVMHRHGLLASSVQKLSSEVAATNGAAGVPSVVVPPRQLPPNEDDWGNVGGDTEGDTDATDGYSRSTGGGIDETRLVASSIQSLVANSTEQGKLKYEQGQQKMALVAKHNRLLHNQNTISNLSRITTDSAVLRQEINKLKEDKRKIETSLIVEEIGSKIGPIMELYKRQIAELESDIETRDKRLRRHEELETQTRILDTFGLVSMDVETYETPVRSNRTPASGGSSTIPSESSTRRSIRHHPNNDIAANTPAPASLEEALEEEE